MSSHTDDISPSCLVPKEEARELLMHVLHPLAASQQLAHHRPQSSRFTGLCRPEGRVGFPPLGLRSCGLFLMGRRGAAAAAAACSLPKAEWLTKESGGLSQELGQVGRFWKLRRKVGKIHRHELSLRLHGNVVLESVKVLGGLRGGRGGRGPDSPKGGHGGGSHLGTHLWSLVQIAEPPMNIPVHMYSKKVVPIGELFSTYIRGIKVL